MSVEFRRSPLALAILGILAAGPLHPYGIQRRIKEWGKDEVINVGQRSSLYKMITRLEESGLIVAGETDRDPRYPERTTYAVTDDGAATSRRWMDEMLSQPRNEYPEFPAALSFLPMLTPEATAQYLARRRDALSRRMEDLTRALDYPLPRVVLLDAEYQRAVLGAELNWVEGIVENLATGTLSWKRDELIDLADRL